MQSQSHNSQILASPTQTFQSWGTSTVAHRALPGSEEVLWSGDFNLSQDSIHQRRSSHQEFAVGPKVMKQFQ